MAKNRNGWRLLWGRRPNNLAQEPVASPIGMRKYYIKGQGEIRLSESDFKARGGQGTIYSQGSTAYKIYTDRNSRISTAKIDELSVLKSANIITPLAPLFDENGTVAGYSMRYIDRAYQLCRLFPSAFRKRHNLTADLAFRLVLKLQGGIEYVHSKGILIVDLNEMNFLVSTDLKDIFFLDVDSYQTPSFPATAIMETVRDRHAAVFDRATDWFAFAIVSFQLFTGLHPYKGTYPPFIGLVDKSAMLDERMKGNISVLHAGVSVPSACLPFDVIPRVYLDWYRSTFEGGARRAPPWAPIESISAQYERAPEPAGSTAFCISQVLEFDSDIVDIFSDVTLTHKSIYVGGRRFDRMRDEIKVALTPRSGQPVALWLESNRLRLVDLDRGTEIGADITASEVFVVEGRPYLKRENDLMQIEFIELPHRIIVKPRPVGRILRNATRLFDGVVLQDLLGACYGSFLPDPFTCYQARLSELDGHRIIDARCEKNVLLVVGAMSGRYDRFILRFDPEFASYDIRIVQDVDNATIDFTVLDSGVCLNRDGQSLELFSNRQGDTRLRALPAPELGDSSLFHFGTQALLAKNNKLYKISLTQ